MKVSFGFPTPPPAPFEPDVPFLPWVTAPTEHDHACGDEPSLPRLLHPLVEIVPLPQSGLIDPPASLPSAVPGLHYWSLGAQCVPPRPSSGQGRPGAWPPPHTPLPGTARSQAPATFYSHHASTTTYRLGQTLRARRSRVWCSLSAAPTHQGRWVIVADPCPHGNEAWFIPQLLRTECPPLPGVAGT